MAANQDLQVLLDFLRLPLSTPEPVFERFANLPGAISSGEGLGRFVFVPGTRTTKVVLVAHADTVWDARYGRQAPAQNLQNKNGRIWNSSGGLGADDRAGCAIVWLLKDLGHSILITDGEEQGQLGAKYLVNNCQDIANAINDDHQFVVEFDRRNGRDFKCYNVATDDFRRYVQSVTGYTEPDRHSRTDIVELCRRVCGVNLSIGFYGEHSPLEELRFDEWANTLNLCRRWLSQADLPRFPL